MWSTLKRLLVRRDGQDLVEYALLVAFVGLVVLAAWLTMQDAIADGYTNWDTQEQNVSAGPGGTAGADGTPNGPLTTPDPQ